MKLNALILLGAIALASGRSRSSHPNGCPTDWSVEKLTPHNDCHKFYQCWDGKLVVHTCPSKLYFSVEDNRCEWAEEVDCSGRDVPEDNNASNESGGNSAGGGNSDPSLAPEICAAEGSEGVLVAHEKCNKYYICDDGKPVALRCPGNLLFNPLTDQCDWPVNVQCENREVPSTDGNSDESSESKDNDNNNDSCNCNPGEAPTICSTENSDSILIAHESCNKYYICCNGKPLVKSCPAILLYNPNKEICDWPENVNCSDRDDPDGDSNGEESNENGGNENGGNTESESSEPNGSSESNGSCGGGNDNPALAPEICAAEDSENVLVAHENCNNFYVCSSGSPVALQCPGDLLFNPQTDQCDWPDNVDCGERRVPDAEDGDSDNSSQENGDGDNDNGGTCNCDPGQAPNVCSVEGSDSALVAHESCNKYYICCNGKPLAQACPTNLLYNPHKEICDWPENVSCDDREVSGGNTSGEDSNENGGNGESESSESESSSECNESCGGGNDNPALAPEICAAEDSENVLVAHENCNNFYVCSSGSPVALQCPGDLLFNPQTDQCDWPDNVDCGERRVPDAEDGDSDNSSQENGDGDNNNGGTCNCDPGQAPNVCSVEGSDSALVAHESCNKYYICCNGKPLAQSCPTNLLYNPHKEICDWPENVSCGDREVSGGNTSGEDSNENGGNGESESSESESSSECNESCGGGNDNPALAPEICAAEDSENVLVAHENCNKFYVCNGGNPVALRCPGNLLFNPQTDQCDWPDNVNCGDRNVPETEDSGTDNSNEDNGNDGTCNCDPGQAPNVCSVEGSDSVLVAHESCNKYYICSNGKPLSQSCPANLLYNPHQEKCDWPENVNCGDREVPSGNTSGEDSNENGGNGESESSEPNGSSECIGSCGGGNDNPALAPEICAAEDSENILVAHENCNKFYVCNGGNPVALRCPGNLLFNPQTDQCDWPDNVNCGDRNVPETEDSGTDNSNEDNGNDGTCNCDPGQAPNVCSVEGSDSVLVAHESCNKYYICSNGKPLSQSCPANLLYNPHQEKCDWPENVNCGDREVPSGNTSGEDSNENGGNGESESSEPNGSSESNGSCGGGNDNPALAPEICAAEDSENVLVAHEDCNKFYVCSGGSPVALRCPGNLLFNPQKDQCDWPDNVNCGDRNVPETEDSGTDNSNEDNGNDGTCNCDPGQAPNVCSVEGSDSVLVAHESCNKYYICSNGKPLSQSCPANLLYNPHQEKCDWPENVNCGDREVPSGNTSGEDSNENGGNGESESSEPNGSSESNGICGGGNDNPALAPEICAAEDSENVLVAHEDCNKFYVCSGGSPVALRCPGNLLFNPQKDQCDWPDNVNCGDRNVPETEDSGTDNSNEDNGNDGTCNCDPGQAPNVCSVEGSDSVLVAHESCNKYYICSNGKPLSQSCPANLLYNPHQEKCDWPENVNCGDREVPSGNTSGEDSNENGGNGESESSEPNGSSESNGSCGGGNDNPALAPEICAAEDSENVLVAHEDCNKFYVCNGGNPVALRCPGNLLFNPQTDQCDWPDNVNCGDRNVPETEDSGTDNSNEGNGNDGTCNCDPGQAPNVCSVEGSDSALVAHESCNKYYICCNGKPLAQSCPGNLLYNPHKEICDWPKNVNCGDREVPGGNTSGEDSNENGSNGESESSESKVSSECNGSCGGGNDNPALAPEICAAEDSDGVLVAHEKCNKFYVCNGGEPVVLRCPVNLLFNPQTDQCDWPENVNCGDREIPNSEDEIDDNDNSSEGTCNCNPEEAPAICASENSENVLVAHESCNKYYICANGEPLAQECPAQLLYNPHKEICDWPENVNCDERDNDSDCDSNEVDNESTAESSEITEECQIPNGGSGNDDPSKAPSICALENSTGVLVAHENCNQFYKCDHGLPVKFICPNTLLFNPSNDKCDWSHCVECGQRYSITKGIRSKIEQSGNADPSQANKICAADGSDGILVAHEQCNKFYKCLDRIPVTLSCPGNLLYVPEQELCDWPENVACNGRTVDDESESEDSDGNGDAGDGSSAGGNDDPSLAGEICATENSDGILVAHENCNEFYMCSEGLPVAIPCPLNLLFQPSTNQCDWPENVDCGDRIIPSFSVNKHKLLEYL